MTQIKIAATLVKLFEYLGDARWELGDLIIDFYDGADIMNPHTQSLLMELTEAMPAGHTLYELAQEIRRVGTDYAVQVYEDIDCAML